MVSTLSVKLFSMKKKNKQNYHHGDLRFALISAAVEMINKQGIEQLTMRNLSEWIGVSRTAAYRHFSNKEDLLTATAIEGFKQFSQALKAARVDDSVDETNRFSNMGKAYISFAIKNPAYYRLMFGNNVVQKNEALKNACDSSFNELLLMIELLQSLKVIAADEARQQAIYIWSLMHGLTSLIIDNKLQPDVDFDALMAFIDHSITKSLI